MKLIFAFFALSFWVLSAKAVYLNWALPNSQYIGQSVVGGTGQITDWTANFTNVYVYESDTKYTSASNFSDWSVSKKFNTAGKITISGGGTGVSLDLGDITVDSTGEGKYYYLVVFNNDSEDAATGASGDYIVSEAVQYTGTGSNGFSNAAVSTEGAPDIGNFYMPDWMGGTWSAPRQTPEPTALALLALGIAGFALRRKAV